MYSEACASPGGFKEGQRVRGCQEGELRVKGVGAKEVRDIYWV